MARILLAQNRSIEFLPITHEPEPEDHEALPTHVAMIFCDGRPERTLVFTEVEMRTMMHLTRFPVHSEFWEYAAIAARKVDPSQVESSPSLIIRDVAHYYNRETREWKYGVPRSDPLNLQGYHRKRIEDVPHPLRAEYGDANVSYFYLSTAVHVIAEEVVDFILSLTVLPAGQNGKTLVIPPMGRMRFNEGLDKAITALSESRNRGEGEATSAP